MFSLHDGGVLASAPLVRNSQVVGDSVVPVGWDTAANNRSSGDVRPPRAAMYVHSAGADGSQGLSTWAVGPAPGGGGRALVIATGPTTPVGDNNRYLAITGAGMLISSGLVVDGAGRISGTQLSGINGKGVAPPPDSHAGHATAVTLGVLGGLAAVGLLVGGGFYAKKRLAPKDGMGYGLATGMDVNLSGDVGDNLGGVGDVYESMPQEGTAAPAVSYL